MFHSRFVFGQASSAAGYHRLTILSWLLLMWLVPGAARAQAPTWDWAVGFGGGAIAATAVDATGSIYETGYFSGSVTFGATTLVSAGGNDIYVVKRTASGSYEWAVQAGGRDEDLATTLALDARGNVVVGGRFVSRSASFGAIRAINTGRYLDFMGNNHFTYDAFVARLAPDGTWQRVSTSGGNGNENATELAVGPEGSVYLTGWYATRNAAFGRTQLISGGVAEIFVARLDSAGTWQWAVSAGGPGDDQSNALAVDRAGNAYLTGKFDSQLATFGSQTVGAAGSYDFFVAKLSAAGVWQWARRAGGAANGESGRRIGTDSVGHVYVAGWFGSSPISFGATTFNCRGRADAFVAKLDSAGNWQWAVQAGSTGDEAAVGLAVNAAGTCTVSGTFASPALACGATTLTNGGVGTYDLFVAQLDSAGAWQWAVSGGGPGDESTGQLAIGGNGGVAVPGIFSGSTATFGTTTLTSTRSSTGFTARLGPTAPTGLSVGLRDEQTLMLFPNPAHDQLTVRLPPLAAGTVTIRNLFGAAVLTQRFGPGPRTRQLDVAALPAGVYVLTVQPITGSVTVTRRFVRE